MGMSGTLEPALEEFRTAEQLMPSEDGCTTGGAVLYQHARLPEAADNLQLSARSQTTALNRSKREKAEQLLSGILQ